MWISDFMMGHRATWLKQWRCCLMSGDARLLSLLGNRLPDWDNSWWLTTLRTVFANMLLLRCYVSLLICLLLTTFPFDANCSHPPAHEFVLHEITMFGTVCKRVFFVTCNNLAKSNISYKIRTVPTLLYGSEVSKDGMTVSANFRLLKGKL